MLCSACHSWVTPGCDSYSLTDLDNAGMLCELRLGLHRLQPTPKALFRGTLQELAGVEC